MSHAATLWLYFLVVFGIIALPGLDMAFVMGSALLGGRRAGLAAVGGIVTGGFCHLAMGALGVAAVLKLWPALFTVLLLGGAAYIAWIGLSLLRSSGGFRLAPTSGSDAAATAFRRAVLTSLLNPKAYIFMLAIFPQFLKPGQGAIWMQAGELGGITALTQIGVYGLLALLSSRAGSWFARHRAAGTAVARAMGALLIATAALTASQALPAVDGSPRQIINFE